MPRVESSFVPVDEWEQFKQIINDFVDNDAGRQPFLWLRRIEQPLSYGEDSGIVYTPVQLEGMFHYNYIKTWPTNTERVSGEINLTNLVLYISANLLGSNGYLNQYGYYDFNWSEDRFILNGKVYKPGGDTQVAQARDQALLFFIILYREDPEDTNKLLQSYITDTTQIATKEGVYLMDSKGRRVKDLLGLPLFPNKSTPDIPARNFMKTADGKILRFK